MHWRRTSWLRKLQVSSFESTDVPALTPVPTDMTVSTSVPTLTPTLPPTPTPTYTPIPTPTQPPSPTATPQPVVTGRVSAAIPIRSCPGVDYPKIGEMKPGQSYVIVGWNTDTGNLIWLLLRDVVGSSQQWARNRNEVVVTPRNFQDYVKRISCRQ